MYSLTIFEEKNYWCNIAMKYNQFKSQRLGNSTLKILNPKSVANFGEVRLCIHYVHYLGPKACWASA